ncbi:MAG: Gfo/Idh/MocA family oxidoreductase [Chitinophagaceae bacterium]|nr:Gfo/Idh/MocA family oxidoreductase [Chitinophagaceae bacterium]
MTDRRDFIRKSLMGVTGLAIGGAGFSARSYRSIIGSNDRINVAVIGIRGRGMAHIDAWCSLGKSHHVRVKTLCDTDEQFFTTRSKMVADKTGEQPQTEWDMHKVLEDKGIDIVSFATPNHWHALGTIWACQAGKHVYVEKPAMHDIWEGRKMIEAARKYDRRVQVGFQNRSIGEVIKAIKFLHDGGIGKVYMARGLCIKPRDSFGIASDSTPPQGFHYDRWLGPAPYRPYNEKHCHYNWHWFWDTGNGDTGNQGPHQFDLARWGLNKNEHPSSIYSNGGIYGWAPGECAQQTPDTQTTVIKYTDGTMLEFETRGGPSNGESGLNARVGNVFYGTDGYLELNGSTWKAYHKRETKPFAGSNEPDGTKQAPESLTGNSEPSHWLNFLDAVIAGKNDMLHCDIREGFYSSALPLLANISYRLGRQLRVTAPDTNAEKIINDPEATAMLTREYRSPYIVPNEV